MGRKVGMGPGKEDTNVDYQSHLFNQLTIDELLYPQGSRLEARNSRG